jgi:hypothetical protein
MTSEFPVIHPCGKYKPNVNLVRSDLDKTHGNGEAMLECGRVVKYFKSTLLLL